MRVAVLVSGRGTNLMALSAAIESGAVPATIALVAADRPAPAAAWARGRGLDVFERPARAAGMADWEAAFLAEAQHRDVEALVLAGFLRILSPQVVARYRERILNVHPSLLPAFPGLDAIGQALEHGVRVTGVTVHLVDEGLDAGPIVLQEAVAVAPGEERASLEPRIHDVEHRLLPAALRLMCEGRLRVLGRRVTILDPERLGEPTTQGQEVL